MLELMKLECKKNLSGFDYISVIFLMAMGVFGTILLLTKTPFYECEELLSKSFDISRNLVAFPVLIAGGIAVKLFGKEIRNSYVLPQGRRKILLSKLYTSIIVLVALYIPFNLMTVSMLRSYPNDIGLLVAIFLVTNLILSISLITIVIAISLIIKSGIINQIVQIGAAILSSLIVTIYTSGVPMAQYVGIVIVIAIIALVTFNVAFETELGRDL